MALIVQKFGGTSLANVNMIRKIAVRIVDTYNRGDDLVVILSAMAGVTDNLIRLAYEASSCPDKRELDVLLATGEQTTVALLAMMLKEMGCKAQSALAHQVGVVTDSSHTDARILDIDVCRINKIIKDQTIAVIAGFQGCDSNGNITTLGRGGSDTSAVAIAAALGADICEIYTDVDGIYTADPNICSKAKKLKTISYDEMFHMANLGTKVLHQDSIDFARKYNIAVHVRSSFSFDEGTMVVCENSHINKYGIIGITYDLGYSRIILKGIPSYSHCDILTKVLSPIADVGISADMFIQDVTVDGLMDFTFTVLKKEFVRALEIEKSTAKSIGALDVNGSLDNAKVSIVGLSMNGNSRIVSAMLDALRTESIDIIMINTSDVKISCIIEEKYVKSAVKILHSAFGLE